MSSAEEGSKTSEESSNDGAMTAARNHNRERQVSSTGESHRPPTVSTIASNTTSSTSCNNDTSPRSKSVKKDIHSAEADNSDKNEEKSENSDSEIAKYTSSSRTFMSNGDTKQQQNGTRDMDPRSDASNASTSRSRPKRRAASSVRFGSYRDIDAVDFSLLDSFRYDGDQRKSNRPSPSKISSKRNKPPSKSGTNTASLKRNSLIASSAQKSSSFKHLASAATRKTIGKNDAASSSTSTTKRNGGDGTSIASSNDLPGIYGLSSTFQNPTKRSKISGSELLKLLPPVLLTRTQDAGSSDDLTPSSLRHLVSKNNGLVDIFNRKTGMIMKGENAINIKDLASALRDHSEYEPIIPRSEEEILVSGGIPLKSGEYRQARTSVNGRISEVVLPQPTIRESKVEGRSVLITQGPHKGLFGTVDSCIPGGWYVLSNVFNDDTLDLDIVVHSDNLKLVKVRKPIPGESTATNEGKESQTEVKDDKRSISLPIIKTIESVELRLRAYEEQEEKLREKCEDGTEVTQLMKSELRRISKCIVDTKTELMAYKKAHEMIAGNRNGATKVTMK